MGGTLKPRARRSTVDAATVVTTQPSDEDLLAMAQAGHPQLGTALIQRYGPDLHRVVHRALGPDADHADVVHDAIVAVLRGIRRIRDASSIRAWIMIVGVNTVRLELRRRRYRRWLGLRRAAEATLVSHPEAAFEGRSILRRVYAILDALADDDRIAFVLHRMEGLPLPEVAERCRCSVTTAKRRVRRADEHLQARASADPELRARIERSRWRT